MPKLAYSIYLMFFLFFSIGCQTTPNAQTKSVLNNDITNYNYNMATYGMKVYHVNSMYYPFVMAYFRTMDVNKEPLLNLTPFNVGLMVEGKAYDPYKKQYYLEPLSNRVEGIRTCIVLDCSQSMWGRSFSDAINACISYVRLKRPSDEIAIITVSEQIQLITPFISDRQKLELLLRDLQPLGKRTRLYDGIAQALRLCYSATASTFGSKGNHIILKNILLISDGNDIGSIVTRDNLFDNISKLSPPIPIYSLAYSTDRHNNFSNIALLSETSYGRLWRLNSSSMLTKIVDKVHQINRHDYVLTFRSYLPVDGKKHNLKILLNYEGRAHVDSAEFETMQLPLINDQMKRSKMALERNIHFLSNQDPYYNNPQYGVERQGIKPPAYPTE